MPRLGDLTGSNGDPTFQTYANIYDQLRVLRCGFILTPPAGVRSVYTETPPTGSATGVDLTGLLQMFPDTSCLDIDYPTTLQAVSPADGDTTTQFYSRWGSKRHRPFSKIARFWTPKALMAVANTSGVPSTTTTTVFQTCRAGYQRVNTDNAYLGSCWVSFSYKGVGATSTQQPKLVYGIQTKYKIAHRMPLYG